MHAKRLVELASRPTWIFCVVFFIYLGAGFLMTGDDPFRDSRANYYANLAESFMTGKTYVDPLAHPTGYNPYHDLSFYNGKYYLYWPPVPALMMAVPMIVFNYRVSDILFTAVFAALNVGLVAKLLDRLTPFGQTDKSTRLLLLLGFAFGTVHFPLALFGRVWFTGQIVGLFWVLLAYVTALSPKKAAWVPLVVGSAAALATLTRFHLLFVIIPAVYLTVQKYSDSRKELTRSLMFIFLPLAIGFFALLSYNNARFDSPFNTGYRYQRMSDVFSTELSRYDGFDPSYLPKNLYYTFVAYPFPISERTWWGGSVFLLSPFLFAAFFARAKKGEKRRALITILTISIILTLIPILLSVGTGWIQFGSRYSLDIMAPLMVLAALGATRWPLRLTFLLVLLSIFQFAVGTIRLAERLNKSLPTESGVFPFV